MRLEGSKLLSREKIGNLIAKNLNWLYFPQGLESVYRAQYIHAATHEFRFRGIIILVLYAFLSYGIYHTLSDRQVAAQWLELYSWVGFIIFAAWVFAFIPKFNRLFDVYTTLGSMGAVAITFVIVNVIGANSENALLHAAMMYAVVIIYGFVGMRFYNALIAGWGGGLIGYIITVSLNFNIDWTFLNRTYTFSSFLGMSLAYAIDRQHRENYLQNCIIKINQDELTAQAQALERLSQIDALTGLANRRHLTDQLSKQWCYALRHQTPLSILMVDIDFFKNYNDHYGHIAGDRCLQLIAEQLQMVTSRSYELAARYGGEEFLLLFPNLQEHEAVQISRRLMQKIKEMDIPHATSNVADYVTISIGVATTIPQEKDNLTQFVRQADDALYKAKLSGRNQCYLLDCEPAKNIQVL